jgi:hypothetical protein
LISQADVRTFNFNAQILGTRVIDFTADTARAIAFARTPDVKFVFSHAGGTVPYLAGRFGIVDEMRVIPGAEANPELTTSERMAVLGGTATKLIPRLSAATRHVRRNV